MNFSLYVDESGESTPARYRKSPYFLITGCVVNQSKIIKISTKLDHIKFKYWNTTNIVFHSYSIIRKEKDFAIFKNNLSLFKQFTNDLKDFFYDCPINILGVIVNQKKAFSENWKQQTVIKRTYGALFENYIRVLAAKNITGKFIQEASIPIQDIEIYQKFFQYQAHGVKENKIDHNEVKARLTSLSFVTKKNMDSLMQLADLLGAGLRLDYQVNNTSLKVSSLNKYQQMIREQAKNKLYQLPEDVKMKKPKQIKYKNFQGLTNLP